MVESTYGHGILSQETADEVTHLKRVRLRAQVKYVKGWGKFKSDTEVEVDLLDGGTEAVSAKNYIIATGSEVTSLPNVNIDEER